MSLACITQKTFKKMKKKVFNAARRGSKREKLAGEIPVKVVDLDLSCGIDMPVALRLLDVLGRLKYGDMFITIYNSMRGFSVRVQEMMVNAVVDYIMGASRAVTNIAQIDFALGQIYEELDNDLINNNHADI